MNKNDKEFVYTEGVRAGKRIYYFDVKQSHNGDKFICITESKKIVEGSAENPNVRFEKHKIFLYKEDYDKFTDALDHVIRIASGTEPVPSEAAEDAETGNETDETAGNETAGLNDEELKINLDF